MQHFDFDNLTSTQIRIAECVDEMCYDKTTELWMKGRTSVNEKIDDLSLADWSAINDVAIKCIWDYLIVWRKKTIAAMYHTYLSPIKEAKYVKKLQKIDFGLKWMKSQYKMKMSKDDEPLD